MRNGSLGQLRGKVVQHSFPEYKKGSKLTENRISKAGTWKNKKTRDRIIKIALQQEQIHMK